MFDPSYLDRMTLPELHTLWDSCDESSRRYRASGSYGLAHFWRSQAACVGCAISRAIMEQQEPTFVRAQLELDHMPRRMAPEQRH